MQNYPTSEELFEILLDSSYEDLMDCINTNPKARKICNKQDFWLARGMKDFQKKTSNYREYVEVLKSKGLDNKKTPIRFGKAIAFLQTPGIPKTPNKITYN